MVRSTYVAGKQAKILAIASIPFLSLAPLHSAFAQKAAAANSGGLEEIIVSARKRDESIMKAPVVIQAISQRQIENMHVTSVQAIQQATPGLLTNVGFTSSGTTNNLRGLGNGGSANYIDQSVALNIDGFTTNSGILFRQGVFDAAQIEVMKGPQSLFYGKSTSAGLIAIHSADPTATWDSKVTVGYEFEADEMDLSGYVSGPLTDDLGIRVAGYHNTSKGWLTNPNPANSNHRLAGGQNDGARLTLKYDNPDIGLRVKLKAALTRDTMNNSQLEMQQKLCPAGGPAAVFALDNCKVDTITSGVPNALPYNAALDFNAFNAQAFATGTPRPIFRNGVGYMFTNTGLGILTVDYDIVPDVTLSSVTALDYVKGQEAGANLNPAVTNINLGAATKSQEFSQEVRLTTNWKDRWYNFMIGGLYNPSTRRDQLVINTPIATRVAGAPLGFWTDNSTRLKSETDSVFGQILLTPLPKWELSAGLRYTHVNKHFVSLIAFNNRPASFNPGPAGDTTANVPFNLRNYSENATTPEVTLKYTPIPELTTFVSYKKGYKGPGFNANLAALTYTAAQVSPFGGERVEGVEGGAKAQLMNGQLALVASGYLYSYRGLQVAFTNVNTSQVTISNGANGRVQGLELGADYNPDSIPGLTVNAFLNYNDSHYSSFRTAPCYGDQTLAAGCVTLANGARYQDLTGRTLNLAPKLAGLLGIAYKWNLSDAYVAGIDVSTNYSSSYLASPELNAAGRQKGYALLNVGARLGASDDGWEISLNCRNCTNNVHLSSGSDGGAASAAIRANGGTVTVLAARPREILLQMSVRPYYQ